jgi:serine/threonine-protein kinase
MGSVWVARHLELGTDAAVKFQKDPDASQPIQDRFRREARLLARLRHPSVVQVFDFGVDAGMPYIAMELLEGEDLRKRLARVSSLPLAESIAIVAQAAAALDYTHSRRVVHRDIKPSNLFLTTVGGLEILKLLDFGIAEADAQSDAGSFAGRAGSPAYMSPEQVRGRDCDGRSDLWALALVLYRMLTGRNAFEADGTARTFAKIQSARHAAPCALAPELPAALDSFFERALAKEPDRRFANVREFMGALQAASPIECSPVLGKGPRAPASAAPKHAPTEPPLGRAEKTESLSAFPRRLPRPDRARAIWMLCAGAAVVITLAPTASEPLTYTASVAKAPTLERVAPRIIDKRLAPVPTVLAVPAAPTVPASPAQRSSMERPQLSRSDDPLARKKMVVHDPVFGLPVRAESRPSSDLNQIFGLEPCDESVAGSCGPAARGN